MQGSAGAQGVAQTIKALPGVDVSKYGVFAGDMDPTMIDDRQELPGSLQGPGCDWRYEP